MPQMPAASSAPRTTAPAGDLHRTLVESLRDVVFQTDAAGAWSYLNPAWAEITGFPVADTLGRPFLDYVHPEDRERNLALFAPLVAGMKEYCRHEVRYLTRDGGFRWIEVHARLVLDGHGGVSNTAGTLSDVTTRRVAELRLRDTSSRFAALLGSLQAGVLVEDERGRIVLANEAFCSLFGIPLPPDALGGSDCSRAMEEAAPLFADPADFRARTTALIAADRPSAREELALADGRLLQRDFTPVQVDGQPRGRLWLYRDISEERRAEEAEWKLLQEQVARAQAEAAEQQISGILESITDGFVALDRQGRITYVNGVTERLARRPRSALLGRPLWEEFPQLRQSAWGEAYDRAIATRQPTELEAPLPGDPEQWMAVRAYPGEDGVTIYVQDATARRRAELALRRSEEQLRQAAKMEAVGRLAGGVAHDFNNLLMVIGGYTQLLLARAPAELQGHLEQVDRAATRAAELTRQLLAFSRQQVLKPRVLNLNALVADTERMIRRLIGEDIRVVTELHPALGRIEADPGQVTQVLLNLAVNARDAMPQGGRLLLRTGNRVLEEGFTSGFAYPVRPGPYVQLSVSDSGHGMDADTLAHVFEPFFTTKATGQGTGLGLSTVYGIVKQSGGYIWARSAPGEGTTFDILLPQSDADAAPAPADEPLTQRAPEAATVLVVEDEAAIRDLSRAVLSGCGFQVLDAGSGDEALALMQRHPGAVDVLLTDVVMPGMGGRALARALALLQPGLKVIFMSGYSDAAIVQQGLLEPGSVFLQKPLSPAALLRAVHDALAHR